MKYEKLNRIPAKRTIWPENTVVDFEAYESKPTDEAFQEIMNWYTEAKTKAETLDKELTELKESSSKKIEDKNKGATDALLLAEKLKTQNEGLEWKIKNLESQLADSKNSLEVANARLLSTQTDFNAMTNRINMSVEQYAALQKSFETLKEEKEKLDADFEVKKLAYDELEIQYQTSLNQLAEVEKTMSGISDLICFYKEWKRNTK